MHLHPTWQRSILSELCKMFPMTQFIVTTHSPLLVQSIEKINLYALVKDNDTIKFHIIQRLLFKVGRLKRYFVKL